MPGKRRHIWRLQVAGALSISALALWLTLRRVPVARFMEILRGADFAQLGPYLALFVLIQLIRAWRWQLLLEPVARIKFQRVNEANAVGLLAVTLLPLRIGEIARPMLVATPPDLTILRALPSIVIERILDGVFTALLLLIALLNLPDNLNVPAAMRATGITALLASVLLLGGLLLFRHRRAWIGHWIGKAAERLNPAWGNPANRWVDSWVGAIRLPRSLAHRLLLMILTALYWISAAFSIQVLGWAVGLTVTFPIACAVTGAITLGAVVPAGPGMAGTLQVSAILTLSLFMPEASSGTRIAAFAHLLWATQLFLQVAWGLLFLPSSAVRQRLAGLMSRMFAWPEESV